MTRTAAMWVVFLSLCIGAPIFFFAFLIVGFLPIVALPAVFLTDPGVASAVLCLVHLVLYAGIYFGLAMAMTRLIWVLPSFWRWPLVIAISLSSVALTLFPIYGFCYGTCDHYTLRSFFGALYRPI